MKRIILMITILAAILYLGDFAAMAQRGQGGGAGFGRLAAGCWWPRPRPAAGRRTAGAAGKRRRRRSADPPPRSKSR